MAPDIVKADSRLRIEYTLSTEDDVIDTTEGIGPLTVTLGKSEIHPAIEKCLIGRKAGDDFEIWLDPSLAFGEFDPNLQSVLEKAKYPQAFLQLKVGDHFESKDEKGKKRLYRVVNMTEEKLFVDGNHPLAGKNIELKAKILELF